VQTGSFGACLMREPALVARCVAAMRDAVSLPVTVKHRIGLEAEEDYAFVRDFVGTVASAGCNVFIVHARNAVLKGLSPKENREIPPLRYDVVRRLKRDFPALTIVLNGGLTDFDTIVRELDHVDGVMIGRAAYERPWLLADVDRLIFGRANPVASREAALLRYLPYVEDRLARGVPLQTITRHLLGIFHGEPGGRQFRRVLSETVHRTSADATLILRAIESCSRLGIAA
jgi:tRNA-dihydrouridine synthase A